MVGGINLEEAKRAMQEEDKFDKELFRQRIKAKHREERLKAKAERRLNSRAKQDEENQEDDESDGGDSLDGSVGDIIDALPDPDKIYGNKETTDDDDGDFYSGPPVAK